MTAPVSVTVEMKLGGSWTNITSYVRVLSQIVIGVGVRNEGGTSDPNTALLAVNNRDGRFTPRNAAGAYYGNLKRGTLLRITVGSTVRFLGEVSEFPARWEPSGGDVWVPLTASGILRRLTHAKALDSTLTTALRGLAAANGDITGYWPCEDGVGSTLLASALAGGVQGEIVFGTPVFDAVDLAAGTHNVPTWGGCRAKFTPASATATEFTAGCYIQFPATGVLTGGEELFRCDVTGTAQSFRFIYSPTGGGGVFLQVLSSDGSTELLATGVISGAGADGNPVYVKVECSNSGANVAYAFSTIQPSGGTLSGTIVGAQIGAPTVARIGAGVIGLPAAAEVGIGHIVLGTSDTALFHSEFDSAREGYTGESVEDRCSRLTSTSGVTVTAISGTAMPDELGPQPDGSLLDVLRAMEKADAGAILYDKIGAAGSLGLDVITRNARYNDQQSQLVLNYTSVQISPPFEPVDDDQQLRNDVKVSRVDGSSARAQLTSGALSTQEYPNGVGPYPFEETYGIYDDASLPYLASWILALGTIDETRFPAVTVDLVKNSSLVASAEALRPGERLRLTNLPAYAGATNVDLQVIGWYETLTNHKRTITFICDPGSIWLNVFELDDATFGTLDDNRLGY